MNKQDGTKAALGVAVLGLVVSAAGCGSDDDGPPPRVLKGSLRYATSSLVSSPDNSRNAYVTILDSLEPQDRVTLAHAREFTGEADLWVYQGQVYVSGGAAPTVTKFALSDDGRLVDPKVINFETTGIKATQFWNNTFISSTKAYMVNGVDEIVVWDPSTMTITKRIPITPKLEIRNGLRPLAGSSDRGVILANGKLYQPIYWTDEKWAYHAPDSKILVFDVNTDQLVKTLDAPCPGLDSATVDDQGNAYFGPWTGGASSHLVLGDAPTCIVKVSADTTESSLEFKFADVTGGREGSVFHYAGNGRFVMSVFHHERVDVAGAKAANDPWTIISGLNWHLWSYDPKTRTATEMQSVEWNSGAAYWFNIEGRELALVPTNNYVSSNVYELGQAPDQAKLLFGVDGWNIRLFKVR